MTETMVPEIGPLAESLSGHGVIVPTSDCAWAIEPTHRAVTITARLHDVGVLYCLIVITGRITLRIDSGRHMGSHIANCAILCSRPPHTSSFHPTPAKLVIGRNPLMALPRVGLRSIE